MNQPQSLKADAKNVLLSSEQRETIASVIHSAQAPSQVPSQDNSPVIHVSSAGVTLLVLNVEFSSEAARLACHVPGTTIFAAAGPFAEMFVKPTDEVIDALINVPGIRRIEPENPVRLPPSPSSIPDSIFAILTSSTPAAAALPVRAFYIFGTLPAMPSNPKGSARARLSIIPMAVPSVLSTLARS